MADLALFLSFQEEYLHHFSPTRENGQFTMLVGCQLSPHFLLLNSFVNFFGSKEEACYTCMVSVYTCLMSNPQLSSWLFGFVLTRGTWLHHFRCGTLFFARTCDPSKGTRYCRVQVPLRLLDACCIAAHLTVSHVLIDVTDRW